MCTYIRTYTYTFTLVTFSAEIVIFRRCILQFPDFPKVRLFAAVSLFHDNRKTIFSHKINLKLFQKQYNSLIKKAFLMFPIYKKSKDHGRVERTQQPPSTTRQLCTVTLIVSLFAQQYFVCLLFCNTILYKSLACIPKNF